MTNRGENVFNAYIMLAPFVLNCCVGVLVGSARLFSLCSSVVNRNEWAITSSRYGCTIGTKQKGVKFFFKFFFRGVWARGVWARGCGRVGVGGWGVGAWVWARGLGWGRAGWRRDRDGAGWIGIVAVGWARIASLGFPIPKSDCRLGCDR